MFLIMWNILEEGTIKGNKSCILLTLDKTEQMFCILKNGGKNNEFDKNFKINVCE